MQLTVDSGQLPVGWEVKTISEVTIIVNGGTPKSDQPEYWNGDIFWITPKDMGKLEGIYVSNTSRQISQAGLQKSSAKLIPENSVILSTRAPIGHLAINQVVMATNQGCRGLVPKLDLDTKFLFYFLKLNIQLLNELGIGTTFKELSTNALAGVKIPIPPVPEQKRIVAVLDEAFEGINRAISNTEKNLSNAREVFESYLNSIFSQKGEGWEEKKLGEVCQFENGDRGKNYPNREEYVESGIPWINTGHIQPNGTLSQSEMNFITQEKYESLRSGKIQQGDLVYCLRGATIGKTALVDPLTVGAVASSLVIIRPSHLLDSHFLYYFLTSLVGQRLIKLYDNGAAQPNLGARSVAKYIIYLPNFVEQKVIVQKLLDLSNETQRLENIYRQKLAALKELKQSILQKAFMGELTADKGITAIEETAA
jgi:type I restriction enzyme S subunit